MKIAILGTGLIGQERIQAIQEIAKNHDVSILGAYDINQETLKKVQNKYNIPIFNNLDDLLNLNPDWTFIAATNDAVLELTEKAFKVNSHVLIEKPCGRNYVECNNIINLKPNHLKLHVGFNYRFFAGVEKAIHDVKTDKFGKLISVNLTLGHGENSSAKGTWKLDPIRRGSVVADLGVHLFDLILQLSDEQVNLDYAKKWSGFWDTGIDEEAHMMLSNESGTMFNAQVSFTRWRSTFKLEIKGTEGYGIIEGRGRSYGGQTYITGKRWGWENSTSQADSEEIIIDKDPCIDSFTKETLYILGFSHNSTSTSCTHIEAQKVMKLLNDYDILKLKT